eukprot:6206145-Pleurochrysis_carterae.AAC.1
MTKQTHRSSFRQPDASRSSNRHSEGAGHAQTSGQDKQAHTAAGARRRRAPRVFERGGDMCGGDGCGCGRAGGGGSLTHEGVLLLKGEHAVKRVAAAPDSTGQVE